MKDAKDWDRNMLQQAHLFDRSTLRKRKEEKNNRLTKESVAVVLGASRDTASIDFQQGRARPQDPADSEVRLQNPLHL
jgi:hypothetical protein